MAVSKELPLGRYVVVETVQPNGYELDTTEYDAPLVYADQVTAVVHSDHFLYNQPASMFVKKVSISDENKLLSGAQFVGWEKSDEAAHQAPFAVFAKNDYKITSALVDYLGALSVEVTNVDAKPVKSFNLSEAGGTDGVYGVFSSDEPAEQGEYVLRLSYTHDGKSVAECIRFVVNEHDSNAIFALGDLVAVSTDTANCFDRAIVVESDNDPAEENTPNAAEQSDEGEMSEGDDDRPDDESMDEPDNGADDGKSEDIKVPSQVVDGSSAVKRVPVVLAQGGSRIA